MIYLDTAVVLAELFAEDVRPPEALWAQPLVSSRLLAYELWNRIHARGAVLTHGDAARDVLSRVSFVELLPAVLARALEPFPTPVRTLDAMHLATASYLVAAHQAPAVATYDDRMRQGALGLGLELAFD